MACSRCGSQINSILRGSNIGSPSSGNKSQPSFSMNPRPLTPLLARVSKEDKNKEGKK